MTKHDPIIDDVECVQPHSNASWVVATAHGFRLWTPDAFDAPMLAETRAATSSPAVFRQLLAGCMASAWVAAGPALRPIPSTAAGLAGVLAYVHGLCGAYLTTHRTPGLFRRAAERMQARGQTALCELARQKAVEETGHDRLVLRDLAAFGLPAETLVAAVRPRRPLAMLSLFEALCDSDEPCAVFGYSYVLERLAAFRGEHEIAGVQHLVRTGIDVTRGARVHSSVGADAGHVEELATALCVAPPAQRRAIAAATWRTARLQADAGLDDYDAVAFAAVLRSYGWKAAAVLATTQA